MIDIYGKHWVNILDAKVLKVGMYVKTCLDCSDILYETDDNGEEGEELHWFMGPILRINFDQEQNRYEVTVRREDMDTDNSWVIILDKETIEYIEIWVKEWDD